MTRFERNMESYAEYHQNTMNKLTHFFGVPAIVYSIFLFLACLRFQFSDLPLSGATLFFFIVFIYYILQDWQIALVTLPSSLLLLWLAERTVTSSDGQTVWMHFLVTFFGGWVIQFVGHAFEGKKPALFENLAQIFNAPLFLSYEIVQWLGIRKDLRL